MKQLRNGGENREYICLLIALTSITSEGIQSALQDYFVAGWSESDAAALNGVKQPNLKKAIDRLNEVAETTTRIVDIKFKQARI